LARGLGERVTRWFLVGATRLTHFWRWLVGAGLGACVCVGLWTLPRQRSTQSVHRKRLIGWLVAVQGPKDPQQQLYAAVAQRKAAYPSLEYETGHAEALVGDHLSVMNERVEFQRRLTDGEIARLRLKAGEVKRFE
jgi:hypothetical protein